MTKTPLKEFFIRPSSCLRETIAYIDRNGKGIVLVVDEAHRLLSTVTDGDLRRAILAGMDLSSPVEALSMQRVPTPYPTPLTAPVGTPEAELLRLMNEYALRHIPLVDEAGRVVDLALLSDLVKEYDLPLRAVVMAGGYGERLRPLTEHLPKVMLPIGDRPLLELILDQLREAGIRRVHLTTHYKAELITQHFGDGRDFGVDIQYIKEDAPLGTAGSLAQFATAEPSEDPLLVMNGDILTRVNFRAMLDFHREHKADLTVAVYPHEVRLPYGVVETDGTTIVGISEKPLLRHFINAGIYLLNLQVCRFVPSGQAFDMPDFVNRLIREGCQVVSFPLTEYWLDIGHVENYQKALDDLAKRPV